MAEPAHGTLDAELELSNAQFLTCIDFERYRDELRHCLCGELATDDASSTKIGKLPVLASSTKKQATSRRSRLVRLGG